MTSELRLDLEGEPPRLVLRVSGEIDMSNVDRFRRSLAAGEGDGSVLVVDLDHVDYLDSAGIAALFDRARCSPLEIVAGPGSVAAPLIRITRLGEVARVAPSDGPAGASDRTAGASAGAAGQGPAGTESGKN